MKNLSSILLLCLGLSLAGSAAGQEAPAEGSAETLPEYIIGIEDVLRIVVWDEPDLTITAKVRPDGKITVPLISDVEVAGSPPEAVRDRITEELAQYVKEPNVTVIVEQINNNKVYVLGEVASKGAVPFYRPIRLLQFIAMAGGLTEYSNKKIILVREVNGVEKRVYIDYKKLVAGDPSEENLLLKPGDMLLFN